MKETIKKKACKINETCRGWKTIGFNIVTGLLTVSAWPQVIDLVDPQIMILGVTVANFALRYLTTGPVGKKE